MEFAAAKKTRSRKRKRNAKSKRRVQRKLEVKGSTSARRKVFTDGLSAMRDEPQSCTMDAHSFWDNYKVAQEWQQRHSVAWWKSRCRALEYENQMLREKIRSDASRRAPPSTSYNPENDFSEEADDVECPQDVEEDDENLEFQVDKDMLNFLEQSIRHKIELKRFRESEEAEASTADAETEAPFVSGEARVRAKTEDARLLYGAASPGIMAMEAALQATVDRHKDRAKPNYWPNIPLKP